MIYRIKKFIILALPLITVITVIVFVKYINEGEIIIYNAKNSIVSVNNDKYEITDDKFEIKSWPGDYSVIIKKTGYQDYTKKITLERGETEYIDPLFIYIPIIEKEYNKNPYIVPDEYKQKDESGNILYSDNQFVFEEEKIKPKLFTNLPTDIFYILFNNNGTYALIASRNEEEGINELYFYNTDTEEIKIISSKTFSGISWNDIGDTFSFYESDDENNGNLFLVNIDNLQPKKITSLYNVKNLRIQFALYDDHIIILPLDNEKDIIDLDINNERKQKLTFTNDVNDFKISQDSTKIFFIRGNTIKKQANVFDLKSKELYEISIEIKDLSKIEYLDNIDKIIFAQTENGIFDGEINTNFFTEDIMKNIAEYEVFYFFDLKNWQRSKIPVSTIQIEPISFFTNTDSNGNIHFKSVTGTNYILKMTE